MSNGGVPPLPLNATDYSTIKNGECITSGIYAGCIKVGATYYRLERGEEEWELDTGTSRTMVKMVDEVWDLCKEGGDYEYNQSIGGWTDSSSNNYQWSGPSGGSIYLVEV